MFGFFLRAYERDLIWLFHFILAEDDSTMLPISFTAASWYFASKIIP